MLRDTIREDFITSKKARDAQKSEALSLLVSTIKNAEIDGLHELSDEEVIKVLRSELKKRQEAVELYTKGNRQDLVDKEVYEAKLIEGYLPAQMSAEEIGKVVDNIKNTLGDGTNFGQVMQAVMKELGGRADGKMVSEVVRSKMS